MLSILAGQSASELVGWAPWEGQRCLCRAGTKEREQKGLLGHGGQSRLLLPMCALHFAFACCEPGRSPLKSGIAEESQKGGSPGSVCSTKPSWLVLCSAAEPVGIGTFLHPFPSIDAQCLRPRAHGRAVGQGGWRHGGFQMCSIPRRAVK